MRSTLLAPSAYCKYYPTTHTPATHSVHMDAPAPFHHLRLSLSADRLYFLDGKGHLLCLYYL